MKYQPERYLKDGKLNPDVIDPDSAAFGFGRRSVDMSFSVMPCTSYGLNLPTSMCPGKYFANNSLYMHPVFWQLMIRAMPSSSNSKPLVH